MQLKKFWNQSFLGQVQSKDPKFFNCTASVLILYIFIHLFRLEMYPLYMFAMFSKPESPQEVYHIYEIYDGTSYKDLTQMDYRAYTVLMNTVSQFDQIKEADMKHPEAKAIDKFVDRLGLGNTSVRTNLKKSFQFDTVQLEQKFGSWIANKLEIPKDRLLIKKAFFSWNGAKPEFNRKTVIYGLDQ